MADFVRTSIRDFSLANNAYVAASVSFFIPDDDGLPTAAFAILYADLTGPTNLPNPQILDSEGKFAQPVYVDAAVVGQVQIGIETFNTGVIRPSLGTADITRAAQSAAQAQAMAGVAEIAAKKAKRSEENLALERQVLAVQVFS